MKLIIEKQTDSFLAYRSNILYSLEADIQNKRQEADDLEEVKFSYEKLFYFIDSLNNEFYDFHLEPFKGNIFKGTVSNTLSETIDIIDEVAWNDEDVIIKNIKRNDNYITFEIESVKIKIEGTLKALNNNIEIVFKFVNRD